MTFARNKIIGRMSSFWSLRSKLPDHWRSRWSHPAQAPNRAFRGSGPGTATTVAMRRGGKGASTGGNSGWSAGGGATGGGTGNNGGSGGGSHSYYTPGSAQPGTVVPDKTGVLNLGSNGIAGTFMGGGAGTDGAGKEFAISGELKTYAAGGGSGVSVGENGNGGSGIVIVR